MEYAVVYIRSSDGAEQFRAANIEIDGGTHKKGQDVVLPSGVPAIVDQQTRDALYLIVDDFDLATIREDEYWQPVND